MEDKNNNTGILYNYKYTHAVIITMLVQVGKWIVIRVCICLIVIAYGRVYGAVQGKMDEVNSLRPKRLRK